MALKDLVARLETDTRGKVEAIRQQAEVDVRALEAGTAKVLEAEAAKRLQAARAERRRAMEREVAAARHRQRREELEARRALAERIFAKARTLVEEVSDTGAYREALERHLDEALQYLETLRPVVRCQPRFARALEQHLAGRDDVRLIPDEAVGAGVVASAADESVEVDNTLLARLERAGPALAVELLAEVERERLLARRGTP